MSGLRWKVCGLTSEADALAAVAVGADALGFVFWPQSPRAVSVSRAGEIAGSIPPGIWKVGVFVDPTPDVLAEAAEAVGLDFVQLSGDEPAGVCDDLPCPGWKALRFPPECSPRQAASQAASYADCTLVIDAAVPGAYGGTGRRADWSLAAELARQRRVVLAGGLSSENVAAAVEQVKPWAVDVSSGVESEPGRKDENKLRAFAAALEPYR